MDTNDKVESRVASDATKVDPDRNPNDAPPVDLPSSTIIGANVVANNTAPFPGGVAAPAAELAATEAEAEGEGVGPMNLDALEKFGSKNRRTADDGVSPSQRELEAGELEG